jgi:pimeloyl-ACP methyl ester carboxylesterase
MTDATSHFIGVNGLSLHYLDYGCPGTAAVVCLHGLTRNARDFEPVGAELRGLCHVRAVDLRGRGDSDWGPPEDYRLTRYVEDLSGVVDAWGETSVSLIGTSMGGLIAMLFADRYPDRVRSLVLNDVGPEVDPAGAARILATTDQAPAGFPSTAAVIAYFRRYFPPVEALPDGEVWDFAQSSIKRVGRGWTWKLDPNVRQALARGGTGQAAPDLWQVFRNLRCRLLILRGELSDVLSRATVSRMRALQGDATSVEVPGVGHTPLLSEPVAAQALRRFFSTGVSR